MPLVLKARPRVSGAFPASSAPAVARALLLGVLLLYLCAGSSIGVQADISVSQKNPNAPLRLSDDLSSFCIESGIGRVFGTEVIIKDCSAAKLHVRLAMRPAQPDEHLFNGSLPTTSVTVINSTLASLHVFNRWGAAVPTINVSSSHIGDNSGFELRATVDSFLNISDVFIPNVGGALYITDTHIGELSWPKTIPSKLPGVSGDYQNALDAIKGSGIAGITIEAGPEEAAHAQSERLHAALSVRLERITVIAWGHGVALFDWERASVVLESGHMFVMGDKAALFTNRLPHAADGRPGHSRLPQPNVRLNLFNLTGFAFGSNSGNSSIVDFADSTDWAPSTRDAKVQVDIAKESSLVVAAEGSSGVMLSDTAKFASVAVSFTDTALYLGLRPGGNGAPAPNEQKSGVWAAVSIPGVGTPLLGHSLTVTFSQSQLFTWAGYNAGFVDVHAAGEGATAGDTDHPYFFAGKVSVGDGCQVQILTSGGTCMSKTYPYCANVTRAFLVHVAATIETMEDVTPVIGTGSARAAVHVSPQRDDRVLNVNSVHSSAFGVLLSGALAKGLYVDWKSLLMMSANQIMGMSAIVYAEHALVNCTVDVSPAAPEAPNTAIHVRGSRAHGVKGDGDAIAVSVVFRDTSIALRGSGAAAIYVAAVDLLRLAKYASEVVSQNTTWGLKSDGRSAIFMFSAAGRAVEGPRVAVTGGSIDIIGGSNGVAAVGLSDMKLRGLHINITNVSRSALSVRTASIAGVSASLPNASALFGMGLVATSEVNMTDATVSIRNLGAVSFGIPAVSESTKAREAGAMLSIRVVTMGLLATSGGAVSSSSFDVQSVERLDVSVPRPVSGRIVGLVSFAPSETNDDDGDTGGGGADVESEAVTGCNITIADAAVYFSPTVLQNEDLDLNVPVTHTAALLVRLPLSSTNVVVEKITATHNLTGSTTPGKHDSGYDVALVTLRSSVNGGALVVHGSTMHWAPQAMFTHVLLQAPEALLINTAVTVQSTTLRDHSDHSAENRSIVSTRRGALVRLLGSVKTSHLTLRRSAIFAADAGKSSPEGLHALVAKGSWTRVTAHIETLRVGTFTVCPSQMVLLRRADDGSATWSDANLTIQDSPSIEMTVEHADCRAEFESWAPPVAFLASDVASFSGDFTNFAVNNVAVTLTVRDSLARNINVSAIAVNQSLPATLSVRDGNFTLNGGNNSESVSMLSVASVPLGGTDVHVSNVRCNLSGITRRTDASTACVHAPAGIDGALMTPPGNVSLSQIDALIRGVQGTLAVLVTGPVQATRAASFELSSSNLTVELLEATGSNNGSLTVSFMTTEFVDASVVTIRDASVDVVQVGDRGLRRHPRSSVLRVDGLVTNAARLVVDGAAITSAVHDSGSVITLALPDDNESAEPNCRNCSITVSNLRRCDLSTADRDVSGNDMPSSNVIFSNNYMEGAEITVEGAVETVTVNRRLMSETRVGTINLTGAVSVVVLSPKFVDTNVTVRRFASIEAHVPDHAPMASIVSTYNGPTRNVFIAISQIDDVSLSADGLLSADFPSPSLSGGAALAFLTKAAEPVQIRVNDIGRITVNTRVQPASIVRVWRCERLSEGIDSGENGGESGQTLHVQVINVTEIRMLTWTEAALLHVQHGSGHHQLTVRDVDVIALEARQLATAQPGDLVARYLTFHSRHNEVFPLPQQGVSLLRVMNTTADDWFTTVVRRVGTIETIAFRMAQLVSVGSLDDGDVYVSHAWRGLTFWLRQVNNVTMRGTDPADGHAFAVNLRGTQSCQGCTIDVRNVGVLDVIALSPVFVFSMVPFTNDSEIEFSTIDHITMASHSDNSTASGTALVFAARGMISTRVTIGYIPSMTLSTPGVAAVINTFPGMPTTNTTLRILHIGHLAVTGAVQAHVVSYALSSGAIGRTTLVIRDIDRLELAGPIAVGVAHTGVLNPAFVHVRDIGMVWLNLTGTQQERTAALVAPVAQRNSTIGANGTCSTLVWISNVTTTVIGGVVAEADIAVAAVMARPAAEDHGGTGCNVTVEDLTLSFLHVMRVPSSATLVFQPTIRVCALRLLNGTGYRRATPASASSRPAISMSVAVANTAIDGFLNAIVQPTAPPVAEASYNVSLVDFDAPVDVTEQYSNLQLVLDNSTVLRKYIVNGLGGTMTLLDAVAPVLFDESSARWLARGFNTDSPSTLTGVCLGVDRDRNASKAFAMIDPRATSGSEPLLATSINNTGAWCDPNAENILKQKTATITLSGATASRTGKSGSGTHSTSVATNTRSNSATAVATPTEPPPTTATKTQSMPATPSYARLSRTREPSGTLERSSTVGRSQSSSLRPTASQTPPLPEEPLPVVAPAEVQAVETSTAVVSMGTGAIAVSPTAVVQASRTGVLLKAQYCNTELDLEPALYDSPTRYQLTLDDRDDVLRYQVGAAVMNPVLLFACGLLQVAVAAVHFRVKLSAWQKRGRDDDVQAGQDECPTLLASLTWARFPSILVLPGLFLLQPTVSALVTIFGHGAHGKTLMALVIAELALLCGLFVTAHTIMVSVFTRTRYIVDSASEQQDKSLATRAFDVVFAGEGRWIDPRARRASGWTRRWFAVFGDYKGTHRWFLGAECVACVFLGVCAGLLPFVECQAANIAILAFFVAFVLFILAMRPHDALFDLIASLIMALSQASAAGLNVFGGEERMASAVEILVSLALTLNMLQGVIKVAAVAVKALRHVKWVKRQREKGIKIDDDGNYEGEANEADPSAKKRPSAAAGGSGGGAAAAAEQLHEALLQAARAEEGAIMAQAEAAAADAANAEGATVARYDPVAASGAPPHATQSPGAAADDNAHEQRAHRHHHAAAAAAPPRAVSMFEIGGGPGYVGHAEGAGNDDGDDLDDALANLLGDNTAASGARVSVWDDGDVLTNMLGVRTEASEAFAKHAHHKRAKNPAPSDGLDADLTALLGSIGDGDEGGGSTRGATGKETASAPSSEPVASTGAASEDSGDLLDLL